MPSIKRQREILRKYFVDISPTEFRRLLEESCPETMKHVKRTRPANASNVPGARRQVVKAQIAGRPRKAK